MITAELDKLAHSMAFEFAESVIRSEGITMRDEDDDTWELVDDVGEVELFDAVRYLEARGLLERHPEHNDWVRVLDESEATA
jgi:hypothetical protein